MKNGSILRAERIDFEKDVKGVLTPRTFYTYDVICDDQTIDSFTSKSEDFKAGDLVFIIEVNGYKRGYHQDVVTKESIKAVKDFKAEWNKMWS